MESICSGENWPAECRHATAVDSLRLRRGAVDPEVDPVVGMLRSEILEVLADRSIGDAEQAREVCPGRLRSGPWQVEHDGWACAMSASPTAGSGRATPGGDGSAGAGDGEGRILPGQVRGEVDAADEEDEDGQADRPGRQATASASRSACGRSSVSALPPRRQTARRTAYSTGLRAVYIRNRLASNASPARATSPKPPNAMAR